MRYVNKLSGLSSKVAVFLLVLSLFLIFNIFTIHKVFATYTPSTQQKGMTVAPIRSELNIAPGTSLDGVIKVTNSTDKLMTVNLDAEAFSVINQQYDYAFTAESNTAKWVRFDQTTLVLSSQETREVKYTVAVPLSAEPGGRYLSIFISADTTPPDASITSRQRIASLLYINVTGDVTRSGHLLSLSSPWVISDKSQWSAAVQNTGTTHFRSRYGVVVKDVIFSNEVASTSGTSLILPGTVRLVIDNINPPSIPGLYKVIYTIGLGDTPSKVEVRYMLYIPVWLTVLIITTFVILVLPRLSRKNKKP